MKYSIIPEMIVKSKIKFFNEKSIEITICQDSPFKYISPFQKPFIVIDTFARKTSRPKEIVNIEIDELKKLKFIITSVKAGRSNWFPGQRIIYRIESIFNISPGSKKLNYIPTNHSIKKDIVNNSIRIIGPNAGYPRKGGGGPWISIGTK